MRSATAYTVKAYMALFWVSSSCGQESVTIPDTADEGICGSWYPSGNEAAEGAADAYGTAKGDVFPCAVFESARQGGKDTYINLGDLYLEVKHGEIPARAALITIGADKCPGCAVLIEEMARLADAFDAAGAIMIGAAWCDNTDPADCDFDIDRAETVLAGEGWPTSRWLVTNDKEGHLRPAYSDVYPTVIVINLQNMKVRSVESAPNAIDLLTLVNTL